MSGQWKDSTHFQNLGNFLSSSEVPDRISNHNNILDIKMPLHQLL